MEREGGEDQEVIEFQAVAQCHGGDVREPHAGRRQPCRAQAPTRQGDLAHGRRPLRTCVILWPPSHRAPGCTRHGAMMAPLRSGTAALAARPHPSGGPLWKRLAWFGGLTVFAAFTTALSAYGLTSSLGL